MKKRVILITVLTMLILAYNLVAVITPMDAVRVEIQVYDTDLLKEERKVAVSDLNIVQDINDVLTRRIYYKQPLINTWSGSEVEYKINIYNGVFHRDGVYRILINENEISKTRYAYRSRLDVLEHRSLFNIFKGDFSVRLSTEQVEDILLILKKYEQY